MATRKSTTKSRTVPFKTLRDQYVAKKGNAKADKGLRQAIREHRADLEKVWPGLSDHVKGAPYPEMPRTLATSILKNGVGATVKASK